MPATDPSSFEHLPLGLVLQVDALARQAERAWRSGSPASIESLLDDVHPDGRAALLEELLVVEAEALQRRGESTPAEDWARRFPEHRKIVDRVVSEIEAAESPPPPPAPPLPKILGYTMQRELGRGAMGIVYLARHERLQRQVAIKVVAPGVDLSQAFAIVRAEAEIIARLRHPNIVQVYEIGRDHGVPFLSLEYVEGESLRERLRREPIAPREAARLVEQIARAIHHAHVLGVVHRDLKPSNILLSRASHSSSGDDGDSAGALVPKVSDFGLAKVLDAIHDQSQSGTLLGTPRYMSPEQAEGRTREVGPPTDVYALGAILFEMLAGRAPFEAESSIKLLSQISEATPAFPAEARRTVDVDLQAICLKCLEKAPVDRYASARELADDIRRHLDDFPVIALRPSRFTAAMKFVRRNRVLVATAALLVATIIAGAAATAFFAIREAEARDVAESSLRSERRNVYHANIRLAQQAWRVGKLNDMRQLLEPLVPTQPGVEDLRGFEWHYLSRLSKSPSRALIASPNDGRVAFSPDGKWLATPNGSGGRISVWDVASAQLVFELQGHADYVMDLAFTPDGKRLASGGRDRRVVIWDMSTRDPVQTLSGHKWPLRSLAFSPDGTRLASADETDEVIVWNVATGEPVWNLKRDDLFAMDVDFSPDGKQLAVGCGLGTVMLLNAATGDEMEQFQAAHGPWLTGIAFSPDGLRLATCGGDKAVKVWDLATATTTLELRGHADWITGVAYARDGQSLVTSSRDGMLKVWEAQSGRELDTLKGHSDWVRSVAISNDGRHIASGSLDNTVRIWNPQRDEERRVLPNAGRAVTCMTLFDGGRKLVAGHLDGNVTIFDVPSGQLLCSFAAGSAFVASVAASPDGQSLAIASHDALVRICSVTTGEPKLNLKGHTAPVLTVAYDPARPHIASADRDGTLRIWDRDSGASIQTLKVVNSPITDLAFSPDGRQIAIAGPEETQLWDVSSWKPVMRLKGHTRLVHAVRFSPDGALVATASADQTVRTWNAATGEPLAILRGHTGEVTRLSFSADGSRLITGGHDGTLRLWNATTGQELLTFPHHSDWVNGVQFDPQGNYAASCSNDGTIRVIESKTP